MMAAAVVAGSVVLSGSAVRAGQSWDSTIAKSAPATTPVLGQDDKQAAVKAADAVKTRQPLPTARSISLSEETDATQFAMTLSQGVRAEIYTLADPYRVIIDLPDVTFDIAETGKAKARGLVLDYRFGLFSAGKARVVIDTRGPVKIAAADMKLADATRPDSGDVVLRLRLQSVADADFVARAPEKPPEELAPSQSDAQAAADAAAAAVKETIAAADERTSRSRGNRRPVVMIDPGHGGVDPGASGGPGVAEKAIVLAVAKAVAKKLEASGRFDIHLTRDSDVFVSLDERVRKSRAVAADLFISLHADAIGEEAYIDKVRGASIYTLSDRASDEQARAMAEKENASDLIAGLETDSTPDGDEVRDILIDLMARETANFSARFSNVLAERLKSAIRMSRTPQRSAAFKVLKQPHAPSVLVELGYISNEKDRRQLTSADWQDKAAGSIARAIGAFFTSTARHR